MSRSLLLNYCPNTIRAAHALLQHKGKLSPDLTCDKLIRQQTTLTHIQACRCKSVCMHAGAGHGLTLQGVGDAASNESCRVCPPYAKGGVDEARAVAVPCNM